MVRVKSFFSFFFFFLLLLLSSGRAFAWTAGSLGVARNEMANPSNNFTASSTYPTVKPYFVTSVNASGTIYYRTEKYYEWGSLGDFITGACTYCAAGWPSSTVSAMVASTTATIDSSGNTVLSTGTVSSTGVYAPTPLTPDQNTDQLMTSGTLRDATGNITGYIDSADLSALQSGSATGMACSVISSGDTACAYTAPSGNSYLSVVATGGGAPSAMGQAALETMLYNHRAAGENIWSVPDLQALAEARNMAGRGQSVDVNTTTGYVTGISQNTSGTTTVDITLFSSPVPNIPDTSAAPISSDMAARIASGGGGSNTPSPPSTVGSTTSTASAPALGGTSPAVNYVEQAMSNIASQPNIASEAPAVVYQFFGGGAGGSAGSPTVIRAVNTATGQQVGSVTVEGTPLTADQVAEAVALGVQRGLAAQVGGIGSNSGNVSPNPTTTGGSLPVGDAVRAGTGTGSSALVGNSPFYVPSGKTLNSVTSTHLAALQATPFVAGLHSIVPSFGGGSAPVWCINLTRFHANGCVDFTQYPQIFLVLKLCLVLAAAYQSYYIVLGRS